MRFRRLGSTELMVSVIGIGTWQYGGEWGHEFSQGEVDAILGRAGALGINLIDTAECYGDHLSERLIGQALKHIGAGADDWIVASKFGHRFRAPFQRDERFDPASVQAQLEESLKALQRDCIDLYQFHSGSDAQFDNDALWSMLAAQRQAGKIRHLGISISSKLGARQARLAAEFGAELLQVVYNRINQKPATDGTFAAAEEFDLGVLARVPLASGFLSGKYDDSSVFPKTDLREAWPADSREAVLKEVEAFRRELPGAQDMAAAALAWCLEDSRVSAVIPGCKNPGQVDSNASAAALLKED